MCVCVWGGGYRGYRGGEGGYHDVRGDIMSTLGGGGEGWGAFSTGEILK